MAAAAGLHRPRTGHRGRRPARAHAHAPRHHQARGAGQRHLARPRHARLAAQLRGRAALRRRRPAGHRPLAAGARVVRAHPPARSPRHARQGDGVLPVQQHRHRRRPPAGAGLRARRHRGLGRAPRQRHAGGVLRRAARAVRLGARVAALPGERVLHGVRRGGRPRASPSTSRCPPAPTTATTRARSTRSSTPSCGSSRRRRCSSPPGQDIHRADPLGDMRVDEAGFAQMALRCVRLAQELCDGRLAFVLEGGYDRAATARAVEAVLRTVLDESAPEVPAGAAARRRRPRPSRGRARCSPPTGASRPPSP